MLFNSKVGKFQTEKYQRCSAQTKLYPFDIAKYFIALLNPNLIKQIGDLVKASFVAK